MGHYNSLSKKEIKGLLFHIEAQDYFGTLATHIDLTAQLLEVSKCSKNITDALYKQRDKLMYL